MRSLLVAVCVLAVVGCVQAWGAEGHKTVAEIAWNFMSQKSKDAFKQQSVAGQVFYNLAMLPDYYRSTSQGAWSSNLHYVNVPPEAENINIVEDCKDGCVITAIYNYTEILNTRKSKITSYPLCSSNESSSVEPCPLSFLIHFVGDLHQPMHVGFASDRGGNDFTMEYCGTCTNMHSVWDSRILVSYLGAEPWLLLADEIVVALLEHPELVDKWEKDLNVLNWGNQSFEICQKICYNMEPGTASIFGLEVDEHEQAVIFGANLTKIHQHVDIEEDQLANIFAGKSWSYGQKSIQKGERTVKRATCIGPQVCDAYYQRNIWRVKQRLAMGGIHLAALINSIYDPSNYSKTVLPTISAPQRFDRPIRLD